MESQRIQIIIPCEYNKIINVCSSSYFCMLQVVMRKSLPTKGFCSIVVFLIRLLSYFTYYSLNPFYKGTTCTTLLKEDVILQTTPLKKKPQFHWRRKELCRISNSIREGGRFYDKVSVIGQLFDFQIGFFPRSI